MFGRKRTHLVERAVERLAQSGELDASATHLLDPDQSTGQAYPHADPSRLAAGATLDAVLPPPRELRGADHIGVAELEPASDMHADGMRPDAPEADDGGFGAGDGATDQPTDEPADEPADQPLGEAGPHTLMPGEEGAGQPFVDMTSLFRAGMIDWNRVRSRVSEEFRLVQRQIVRTAFTAAGAEPGFSNLLMITSSIPIGRTDRFSIAVRAITWVASSSGFAARSSRPGESPRPSAMQNESRFESMSISSTWWSRCRAMQAARCWYSANLPPCSS